MTTCKIDLRFGLILLIFALLSGSLTAQEMGLRLSIGAAGGYAPLVSMGNKNNAGVVVGVFGEMEYGQLIGRLQFTKPMLGTFEEDSNRDGGEAYHGSLGYCLDLSEQFFVGLMLSGGATVIHYNNGIFGSSGDQFTNVSPQVGVNIIPTYHITDQFSVQGGLRYYKGFEAGDRGKASDLADISVGLRFSIGGR